MKCPHQRRWPFRARSEPSGTLTAEPRGLLVRPGRRRGLRVSRLSACRCRPAPPSAAGPPSDAPRENGLRPVQARTAARPREAGAVCHQGERGADGPPFGGARAARGPVGGVLGHQRQGPALRRLAPSFRDSDCQEAPGAMGSSRAGGAPRSCEKDVGCRGPRR